jgi:hypothetical protein
MRRHPVDDRLVGERHQQGRRLADQDEDDRDHDPRLDLALAPGPQHREEAEERCQIALLGLVGRRGVAHWPLDSVTPLHHQAADAKRLELRD